MICFQALPPCILSPKTSWHSSSPLCTTTLTVNPVCQLPTAGPSCKLTSPTFDQDWNKQASQHSIFIILLKNKIKIYVFFCRILCLFLYSFYSRTIFYLFIFVEKGFISINYFIFVLKRVWNYGCLFCQGTRLK